MYKCNFQDYSVKMRSAKLKLINVVKRTIIRLNKDVELSGLNRKNKCPESSKEKLINGENTLLVIPDVKVYEISTIRIKKTQLTATFEILVIL